MKHILIACCILFVVLAFCIFSMAYIRNATAKTLDALTAAYEYAENRDFVSVSAALARTERCWRQYESFCSALLAHDEVDRIVTDLASLREYARLGDTDDFLATAASLAEAIRHMRQAELPLYYNIL